MAADRENDTLRVTVIIPVYNEEKTLGKCLRSLAGQTYDDFEVVVVDDGSNDGSVEIARQYDVKLIHQNHIGPMTARNRGADESTGDVLVFLDADMVIDKYFLEQLAAPINRGEADGTFYRYALVANPKNVWSRCWSIEKKLPFTWHMHPSMTEESIIFRAIRRDLFVEAEGFTDVGYGGDRTLYQKLNITAKATPAICYHYNPDSIDEVFANGLWVGKGELLRRSMPSMLANIIKYSFPYSLLRGLKKTILFQEPFFIVFKLVYDFGVFLGILRANVLGADNLGK